MSKYVIPLIDLRRKQTIPKVYITKYALTKGILEYQEALWSNSTPNLIEIPTLGFSGYFYGEGKEWHKSKEAALTRAEEMRKRKIESYQKSIEKLKTLTFQ